MIPRFLVPSMPVRRRGRSLYARRPSTLDERTLVPAMLPIVPLDGRTNIPFSLRSNPLRTPVVPRGIRREDFAFEEPMPLPLQPTDLDERVTVRRARRRRKLSLPRRTFFLPRSSNPIFS